MRLETHDLIGVIDGVSSSGIDRDETTQIYLLSHSLGSVPTIFAARNLSDQTIAGLILLAPIKTLKVFPDEMLKKWEENGVYFMRNNRTGQDLPQGSEFLSEIMRHDAEWNIEPAVRDVKSRFLLIHGEEDKDVLPEHSKAIYGWVRDSGNKVELYIIPNAGHTFNTKHPFEGSSPELNKTLHHIVEWIGNEP